MKIHENDIKAYHIKFSSYAVSQATLSVSDHDLNYLSG